MPELLFSENETNARRICGDENGAGLFQGRVPRIHRRRKRCRGESASAPAPKWARIIEMEIPAGGSREIRLRLARKTDAKPFEDFDAIFAKRIAEADLNFTRNCKPV